MTPEEERAHRAHVASLRKNAAESDRQRKERLALLKKSMRSGVSKNGLRTYHSYSGGTKNWTSGRSTRGAGSWKELGKTPALLLKIHRGGVAGDAYASRQKDGELVATNMLGHTAKERKLEFALDAARHPMVNPIYLYFHTSLSRPEGGRLTIDQWKTIAQKWLKNFGAEGCNFLAIRHSNTANDHCHIIFSRSRPDGTLLSLSNNLWTWRAALRKTEGDLGLLPPDMPIPTDKHVPASDRMVNAERRAARLNLPDSFINPQHIQTALEGTANFDQLMKNLLNFGIQVRHAEKNGRVTGLLFQQSGSEQWLAGSSISRDFSLTKIQARLAANLQAEAQRDCDQAMQSQSALVDQRRRQPTTQSVQRPHQK
jgi:hypothetical protein